MKTAPLALGFLLTVAPPDVHGADQPATAIPTAPVRTPAPASTRLRISIAGRGTVVPNLNGRLLEAGRQYSLTARPGAGSVFVQWLDGQGRPLGTRSQLDFVARSNVVITARFARIPGQSADLLDDVGFADLPARVLSAVNAAPTADQRQVVDEYIQSVAAIQPTALASVCSTVGTAHPELLSSIVSTAVSAAPTTAGAVVRSALLTPGSSTRQVVDAAVAAEPAMSVQIATAVLEVHPAMSETLIAEIVRVVPDLEPYVKTALAASPGPLEPTRTLQILKSALIQAGYTYPGTGGGSGPNDYSKP